MEGLHRLLQRQIRRHLPAELRDSEDLTAFLAAVNAAYVEDDVDRGMLERSLDLSSQELFAANSEMRALLQTLPDTVLILDPRGRVLDVKGGSLDSGLPAEDLRDRHLGGLLDFQPPASLETALAGVCASRAPHEHTLQAGLADGSHEYELRLMPLSGHRALAVLTEVTQRRRNERDLLAARDQAEAATRVKSEFLATMSHEIRTPLNGVIGMTGVLMETELSPEQREYARIIHTSGETLLTLINDILDFSRIEAERMQLELARFSPSELLEETVEMFADQAKRKGVELGTLIEAGVPPRVEGDPGRLRQVLLNLVGNALKFTQAGSVVVSADAETLDSGDIRLEVAVTDTGIGIPPEVLPSLFEPFQQADGSTTRQFGGTGLGLAISRRLVKLMGGEISVHSNPGRGTVFRFHMRLGDGGPAPGEGAEFDALRELSILCVESSDVYRTILERQLGPHTARLTLHASASEALDLISSWPSDPPCQLVIVPMDMPGIDGVEFTRRLRASPAGGDLPVLMLAARDDRRSMERAQSAGVNLIVHRPFRTRHLLTAVQDLAFPERARIDVRSSPGPGPEGCPDLRILVAEDNAVNQRVVRTMLRRLGYRVDVAANGLEALRALEELAYDLVLMDCQMPQMDGYEATRRLRAREPLGRPTKVIALTANAMKGDRERCLDAGMDDYLHKPIRLQDLRSMIEKHFAA